MKECWCHHISQLCIHDRMDNHVTRCISDKIIICCYDWNKSNFFLFTILFRHQPVTYWSEWVQINILIFCTSLTNTIQNSFSNTDRQNYFFLSSFVAYFVFLTQSINLISILVTIHSGLRSQFWHNVMLFFLWRLHTDPNITRVHLKEFLMFVFSCFNSTFKHQFKVQKSLL